MSKIKNQPSPKTNKHPAIWPMVIKSMKITSNGHEKPGRQIVKDMKERDALGIERYGTKLQPFNGRDALVDAYQECLDASVYLAQYLYEKRASGEIPSSIQDVYNRLLVDLLSIREVLDET